MHQPQRGDDDASGGSAERYTGSCASRASTKHKGIARQLRSPPYRRSTAFSKPPPYLATPLGACPWGARRPAGRHRLRAVGLPYNQPAAHRARRYRQDRPAAPGRAASGVARARHRARHRFARPCLHLFNHALLTKMRLDVPPSRSSSTTGGRYSTTHPTSAPGARRRLRTLVVLAIEEQFHLVWPVALFAALKLGRRRAPCAMPCSCWPRSPRWRWRWFNLAADPSWRVLRYRHTPRAFSLLIGGGWRSCGRRTCYAARRAPDEGERPCSTAWGPRRSRACCCWWCSRTALAFPYRGGPPCLRSPPWSSVAVHPASVIGARGREAARAG